MKEEDVSKKSFSLDVVLPSYRELMTMDFDELDLPTLKALYEKLEVERDEGILLSPKNTKIIYQFFSDQENEEKLGHEMLSVYGLIENAENLTLYFTGLKTDNSRYIQEIQVTHNIELNNEKQVAFVNESIHNFFVKLKNSPNKKELFSLRDESVIKIENIAFLDDILTIKLKGGYFFKGGESSHFEYYQDERMILKAKTNSFGETWVDIFKTYKLNLNEKKENK